MKGLIHVVCLVLSLPNLLAGKASLIIRHTFATFHPLRMVTDFFFQVVWGLPLASALFLLLLILGFFARTRPYAALFTFTLNATTFRGPKTGHSFFLHSIKRFVPAGRRELAPAKIRGEAISDCKKLNSTVKIKVDAAKKLFSKCGNENRLLEICAMERRRWSFHRLLP